MNTEPTFQDLLTDFSDEIFVGRAVHLALFEQLFTTIKPPFLIFAICGQGGVGKTTLLEQFRQIADRYKAHHALVNEDHKSILDVLASFAEQFQRAGYSCKTFDERYHKYRELKEQIEADPIAPKGFLDFAVRSTARIGLRALRRVPLAGDAAEVLLSSEAEEQIVNESSAFATYLAQKFTNKDERVLLSESVKELTRHFLADISKLAADRRVILFFDTYERTAPYLDNWLRDLIAGKYGAFHSRVTIVIAGRHALGQPWTAFRRAIRQVELDPFTEEEARQYLERSGIVDEAQVTNFIKLSDRLPVLLAMLTFAPGEVPADLSADAVERFLLGMTEDEREIALCSAIPRHFNQDILAAILGQDKAVHAFAWLSEAHFVHQSTDGWRYHDIVRALILRYLWLRSNAQYAQIHEQMAAHYNEQLTQLGLPVNQQRLNRHWRLLETEQLYHIMAAQPTLRLVNLFDSIFLTALANLEEGTDDSEIYNEIKQNTQIITQIYRESGNENLANWATHANELFLIENDPLAFTQAIKTLFSLLTSLYSLADLTKHAAWLLLASLHDNNKEWSEALLATTYAIQICPNHPYSYTTRATIYLVTKQYSNALTDCTTAIELQPGNDINYYWRGITYYKIGNYANAIRDFTKAIELQPTDSDNYSWRGETYYKLSNHTSALADLTKAIELQPNNDNYYYRGKILYDLSDYSAAIADFTKSIELQPDEGNYYFWRGYTFLDMDNYAAAIIDLTKAIELQPTDDTNYFWRACAYQDSEDHIAAIADLTKAIKLQPTDIGYYQERSHIYREIGAYNDAIADLTQAITLDPTSGHNYQWRGLNHYLMQNYAAAISDFDKAIKLHPSDDTNYYWRGRSYLASRKYIEAMDDLTCAIKLSANNDGYDFHWRGLLHYHNQNYQAALLDFAEAATLLHDPWLNHFWFAVIHFTLGQTTEAMASLSKVQDSLTLQLPSIPPAVLKATLPRLSKIVAGQAALSDKWLTTIFNYLPTDEDFKGKIRWLITYLAGLPHDDNILLFSQLLQDFLKQEHT